MKRLRRYATVVAVVAGLAAVCGWAVGGFLEPPVVARPQGSPSLPPSEQVLKASCLTADGVELRGLFFPSDPKAPVVVHYLESGASPVVNGAGRLQYRELAALGFASLVIDYRGIGNSDGSRSVDKLGVDARAIWDEALRRVDGDESRLLIRATSLGSVATAWLLKGGARPRAVMLHAPVESATAVERFGSRFVPWRWLGVPMEVATRPFLRDWVAPPTLATALASDTALFVSVHVDDPVLSLEEIQHLRAMAAEGRCVLSEPKRKEYENPTWPKLLDGHFDLSIQALQLSKAELAFLRQLFQTLPPIEQRVEKLLTELADPAVSALIQKDQVRRRLGLVLTELRCAHPVAAVAAAAQLTEKEIKSLRGLGCLKWLIAPLANVRPEGPVPMSPPPTLDELLQVFDLGPDPLHRARILRGLDRGRSASLARVRLGDGGWWSSGEELGEAVRAAYLGAESPRLAQERPDLAAISTSLALMEAKMGLTLGKNRVPEEERLSILTETLLRAAWMTPLRR